MAGQIAALVVKVQASLGEFTEQMDKIGKDVNNMSSKFSGATGAMTVAAGNLIASGLEKIAGKILEIGTAVVETSGKLTDMAGHTGLTTTALQEIGFAAEQSGVSLDTITGAIQKLTQNLAKGGGASAALKEIGLSLDDIKGKSGDQVLYQVAQGFDKLDSQVAKARVGGALFGKQWTQVLGVLNSEFAETARKAQEMGVVLSEDTVAGGAALGDQMDVLSLQIRGVVGNALAPMLPMLVEVAKLLGKLAQTVIPPLLQAFVWLVEKVILAQQAYLKFMRAIVEGAQKIPILGKHLGILDGATEFFNNRLKDSEAVLAGLQRGIAGVGKDAAPTARAVLDLGDSVGGVNKEAQKAAAALEALKNKLFGRDDVAAANQYLLAISGVKDLAKLSDEELKNVATTMEKGAAASIRLGDIWTTNAQTMRETALYAGTLRQKISELNQGTQASLIGRPVAEPGIKFQTFSLEDWVSESMSRHVDEMKPITAAAADWGTDASEAFSVSFGKSLGADVLKAFQGGGDIGATVGASIAKGMTDGLADKIGKSEFLSGKSGGMSGVLGGALGGLASAGIGAAVALGGQALSWGLGKLFKSEGKQVNKKRDEFIDAAGGLDALNQQAARAGVTLDALLKADSLKEWDKASKALTASIDAFDKKISDLGKSLKHVSDTKTLLSPELMKQVKDLGKDPAAAGDMFEFFKASTATAADSLKSFVDVATVTSQAGATAIGSSFAVVFEDMRAQGISAADAFAALGPSMETFAAQLTTAGLSGGTAFEVLRQQAELTTNSVTGPLIAGAEALDGVFIGLANTGRMNQEIFSGLTGEVAATFHKIEGSGAGSVRAVQSLQKPLQTIWELWTDQGYAVDDTTRAVLDFAVEQGVVGDKFRDSQERMVLAVEKLTTRIGELVDHIAGDLPGAADTAARGIEGKLAGIKVPTINIPYRFEAQNSLPSAAPASATASTVGAMSSQDININVDGQTIASVTARHLPDVVAPYGAYNGFPR